MPRTVSCAETRCLSRPVARQAIKKAYPAVTSSPAAGMGLDWLSQMISACNGGCYADYINLVSAISPVLYRLLHCRCNIIIRRITALVWVR
jgi:hypothetical protein